MKLEIYNYCQKTTHHAEQDFDCVTWVVWVNTQFATVWFLCLSFFGSLDTCTGRTGGPILTIYASYDIFLAKDVPFDYQILFMGGPNTHSANPRWQMAAILKNKKLPCLTNVLTNLDKIFQADADWVS